MNATVAVVRRQLQIAVAIVMLIAVAGPAALGAAMMPVLRELGSRTAHVCKCGMQPGQCGCPECARLERSRHRQSPGANATIRSQCDDDVAPLVFGEVPCGVPGAATATPRAPWAERAARLACAIPHPSPGNPPPTPPPRPAV